MREIAGRAGVSESLVYRYFGSKDALYEQVILEPLQRAAAEIHELGQRMPALSREGRRQVAARLHVDFFSSMVAMAPLLNRALSQDPVTAQRFYVESLAPLTELVGGFVADAMAGWSDVRDPPVVTTIVMGTYHWLAVQSMLGNNSIDVAEVGRSIAEFVMRALDRSAPASTGPVSDSIITDAEWSVLAGALPQTDHRARGGRWRDHRTVVEAIARRVVTGCTWRQIPTSLCPWQTANHRLRRWVEDGTWQRLIDSATASPVAVHHAGWLQEAAAAVVSPH